MAQLSSRRWLAGAFAGLLGVGGCGGAEPTEESMQVAGHGIVGGEADSEHPNVFGLFVQRGRFASTCTATLLAPNLLLTARHCVSPSTGEEEVICGRSLFGEPTPATDLYATNAMQLQEDSAWFQGDSVYVPKEGNDTCGYDVALIILSRNVPAALATPAVPRIDREVLAGESYVAVGYGLNDSGHAGARRVRRDLEVACEPGACGLGVRVSEFVGETGICEGDSGGPALDADGKVVGVVSRGAVDCSLPVYGTVTAWRELITGVALLAAEKGLYEPPFWATSGKSDRPTPVEPAPAPGGASGDACDANRSCAEGLLCYAADGAAASTCTPLCANNSECRGAASCQFASQQSSEKVCQDPPRADDALEDTGCSASGRTSSPQGWASALGLLLVGGLLRRRRRCQ